MSIRIRPRAALDIDDQSEHFGRINLDLARRFQANLARTFDSLAAMPALGSALEFRDRASLLQGE